MPATNRYSTVAIAFHWVIGLLIIGNLAGGFLHDFVPKEGGQRALVMGLHKGFGFIILALSLLRLGWRIANPPPALPDYFTSAERLVAKAGHWGFYLLMVALPFSGWIMADLRDRPLTVFTGLEVPKLGADKALAGLAHEGHEVMGWAMLALLGLHIVAIVKHKLMDNDNLLPRMGLGSNRA
jgi:cytochrome b561